MRRFRLAAWVCAGWMGFVWVTRISNAVGDETLSGRTVAGALILSIACLMGAIALAWVGWRGRGLTVAKAIAAAHGAVWVVRGVQIALADHEVQHACLRVLHVGHDGLRRGAVSPDGRRLRRRGGLAVRRRHRDLRGAGPRRRVRRACLQDRVRLAVYGL